ncbi:hypothetical protein [Paenibacillus sp. 1781tsa1]|uniref:hypothetical protein n=1 Tax=Paenibacillus sp. 1781tsa1 TaxID=2953810 RepID=UPI00209FA239|nr:hypothetical protein [Paenibacillus sp. 1781tsa1]MCP1184990.1 hypothetical protein [Paenibacillus sp. 1781tsa1]
MNKKRAEDVLWDFHRELVSLSKKFGISIHARSREEIDYDYEEGPYVSGISDYIVLSDAEGNEIAVDLITPDDLNTEN